ncbi:MAG: sugar ABC transporter permease, partial [Acidimicrobiia bacterium]|nr:sugar ABC transporter permease [Acidimicrobiia bacterium]
LMMYQARDVSRDQTGVFNSLWVWLGTVSTGGIGQVLIGLLFVAMAAALGFAAFRTLADSQTLAGLYVVFAVVPLWVAYRAFTDGIGGYQYSEAGDQLPLANNFVQNGPFNNFWLMLIMVWIQTGFAMVILSAGIKAVPTDILEAARIDGATEIQVFWRVIIPTITSTVVVVTTTMVINVLKVFDIVWVMTGGLFGTEVVAERMIRWFFRNGHNGRGAAIAVVLFLAIIPIMLLNVRRFREEEAIR